VLVAARRVPIGRDASMAAAVLVSGGLDMAANILYLLASQSGMLAVVAALTGLYPAATVVLAQNRLGERMAPIQVAGLGVAGLAALLVAS
jgi:drug/metabolite transporter (DMT)-like permease